MTTRSDPSPLPSAGTLLRALARAARLRCPRCGGGGLFASWTRLRQRCGGCGLLLDRGEEDHFLGAYVLNLVVAEAVPAAVLLAGIALSWPAVPWGMLTAAAVALAVLCPIAFFPHSRTLWLALDTTFRRDETTAA